MMFSGQIDRARDLYREYKGKAIANAKSGLWDSEITEDFVNFRKTGLSHSLMPEIEALLGNPTGQ